MTHWQRALSVTVALGLIGLGACVSGLVAPSARYDSRQVSVQFFSLYNQRVKGQGNHRSWQGDWVLRRERLALMDRQLREVKPDLIVLQEVMAKKGSPYEADRRILGAGALSGYDWQEVDVGEYDDTHEVEAMTIATGLPLRIKHTGPEDAIMWRMGREGILAAFSAELEGQALTIFNVKLPTKEARQGIWYTFMEERMNHYLATHARCPKRLLVAGYFGGESDQPEYRALLEALRLVDVSQGFCEQETLCYTATPLNDLYKIIHGDSRPQRSDRILIHQDALVYVSQRNLNELRVDNVYGKILGLNHLWAGPRYGWVATVRFPRCYKNEVLAL